jgi:hemolysin activation/secretion protein
MESISATFVTVPNEPRELLYGSLSGTLPIGVDGTYVSLTGAYNTVDAGGSSAQFDTDSTTKQFIARVGHPIIRSRAQNLWVDGSFDFRNFHQTQFDQTTTDDKLRVFRLNANYRLKDDWKGENALGAGISQGIDFLGASDTGSSTNSRSNGRSQFTKFTGNAARLQGITDSVSFRLGIAGQWSVDPLLSYEEFNLGGEGYGRAYDYGALSGDHGAAASSELRYGGETTWQWLSEYQVYGFYDVGAVWNRIGDDLTMDHLSSAGAGLRLRVKDYFRAGFEAGKPLDLRSATTNDRDWRFFFSAVANY